MRPAKNSTPLYTRVQAAIRHAIRSGQFAPGDEMPTEKELEAAHGVSRITVRRALEELEREGLVRRAQGRPARVTEPLISVARTEIEDDLSAMLELVRGTDPEVLSFAWGAADETVRALLEIGDDAPVLQVERLRRGAGRPMLHTIAYVPAFVGETFTRDQLEKTSMLDVLVESGVKIAHAAQVMHAAPCPDDLAPLLDLEPRDPVFRIERLVRDDRKRPIQHVVVTFRWDSFSYRVSSMSSLDGRLVEMTGVGHMEFRNAAPNDNAGVARTG